MGTDLFGNQKCFLGEKTFCGRSLLYSKTDWLQKLSYRAKNENLFLYSNLETLRFKYLHQNRLCVSSCSANYFSSCANNPHSRVSQVSVGSRILTLWPEEGKHGQSNFIASLYTSLQILVNLMDLFQKYL